MSQTARELRFARKLTLSTYRTRVQATLAQSGMSDVAPNVVGELARLIEWCVAERTLAAAHDEGMPAVHDPEVVELAASLDRTRDALHAATMAPAHLLRDLAPDLDEETQRTLTKFVAQARERIATPNNGAADAVATQAALETFAAAERVVGAAIRTSLSDVHPGAPRALEALQGVLQRLSEARSTLFVRLSGATDR